MLTFAIVNLSESMQSLMKSIVIWYDTLISLWFSSGGSESRGGPTMGSGFSNGGSGSWGFQVQEIYHSSSNQTYRLIYSPFGQCFQGKYQTCSFQYSII